MKKYLKVISILSTLTALAACQFNQVKVITKDSAKNIVKDIANHNEKRDNKYGNAYTYYCHQEVIYKNHGLVRESTQEDFKNTTFKSIYYNEITQMNFEKMYFHQACETRIFIEYEDRTDLTSNYSMERWYFYKDGELYKVFLDEKVQNTDYGSFQDHSYSRVKMDKDKCDEFIRENSENANPFITSEEDYNLGGFDLFGEYSDVIIGGAVSDSGYNDNLSRSYSSNGKKGDLRCDVEGTIAISKEVLQQHNIINTFYRHSNGDRIASDTIKIEQSFSFNNYFYHKISSKIEDYIKDVDGKDFEEQRSESSTELSAGCNVNYPVLENFVDQTDFTNN